MNTIDVLAIYCYKMNKFPPEIYTNIHSETKESE